MSLGLIIWIGFIIFIFTVGLTHYLFHPMVEVRDHSMSELANYSKTFRKIYFALKTFGYTPYTKLKFGYATIDIAIIDIKVAILFYSAEDLLHPKKAKRLARQAKLLERNDWLVIQVREKELQDNFRMYISQILANANRKPITW